MAELVPARREIGSGGTDRDDPIGQTLSLGPDGVQDRRAAGRGFVSDIDAGSAGGDHALEQLLQNLLSLPGAYSVETELVTLDVLHHEARLVLAIGEQ